MSPASPPSCCSWSPRSLRRDSAPRRGSDKAGLWCHALCDTNAREAAGRCARPGRCSVAARGARAAERRDPHGTPAFRRPDRDPCPPRPTAPTVASRPPTQTAATRWSAMSATVSRETSRCSSTASSRPPPGGTTRVHLKHDEPIPVGSTHHPLARRSPPGRHAVNGAPPAAIAVSRKERQTWS